MTSITHCRDQKCRASIVYLPTVTGGNMPCDSDSVGPADKIYDKRRHVSHFKTCRNPNRFSKGARK